MGIAQNVHHFGQYFLKTDAVNEVRKVRNEFTL